MSNKAKPLLTADTFNRGALRMTVALLRGINPRLALNVQNQMFEPIKPQPDANPSPKDNFRLTLKPIEVGHIVESLKAKVQLPNANPGTEMLIKALIIDWVNYANYLIELENNQDA